MVFLARAGLPNSEIISVFRIFFFSDDSSCLCVGKLSSINYKGELLGEVPSI